MNRSGTGQVNLQMSPMMQDNSRINRHIEPPACLTSRLASAVTIFCIGLVTAFPGGLLLGGTVVVLLQSLELLVDKRLLVDQPERYIMENGKFIEGNSPVHDIHMSICAVMFGVFSSTLSLTAGFYAGWSTYSLVIRTGGETVTVKALGYAGSVCLMVVTVTGCILGQTLESFLSITSNVDVYMWLIISIAALCMFPTIPFFSNSYMLVLVCGVVFTPGTGTYTYMLSFLFRMRLLVGGVVTPVILAIKILEKSRPLKLTIVPVPLMLVISDLYFIAGQQIVSLQSPASENTSSAVLEAVFIGVLASLLWTVTVGMSLFGIWQSSGTDVVHVSAAGAGTAVIGAIKLALPVLGPGPTIGALMGVAGAVGVSLSAAGAATDQYGQIADHSRLEGRLGVTVGAAVGAFLLSCVHSGLSGIFISLCAATIPVGSCLKLPFLHSRSWGVHLYSCIGLIITVVLLSLTYTSVLPELLHFRGIFTLFLSVICFLILRRYAFTVF